ncbi:MAG: Gfo/Idh/MocA family oxidoreductase [Ruminococcus sp.]|nr:Gfo/Idh/MocA family oxidoreductase [Ruminococcus sp.]
MKALIVGYGSMGRRRIRLLQKLVNDVEIIAVDSNPERVKQAEEAGVKPFTDLQKALEEKPDIAFVCTSPGHHAEIILNLLERNVHVFTELNLVDNDYDKIISLANEKKCVVFMSSTMLYNKMINKIDEIVKKATKPLTYIYHIGQYLPDWHPWESYKDFFIGKKETNGVREIFAIQLPWIINTFGKIDSITSNSQRCTGLEIEFNDSIIADMRHENGNIGVFLADTVSRKAITSLEIVGEELHLFWHGHNDDLEIYNLETKEVEKISVYDSVEHTEGYADNIIENQYTDEIKDFLNAVYKGTIPKYSIEKDKYTLSIIDQIEGE